MVHHDFDALTPTDVQTNSWIGQDNKARVRWWLELWIDRHGPLEWTRELIGSLADAAGVTLKTAEAHLTTLCGALSPFAPFFKEVRGRGNDKQTFIHRKTPEMLADDAALLAEIGVTLPQDSKQSPKKSRPRRERKGGGNA